MWKVDQRVFGRKGNEQFWYVGTVRHIDDQRCYVIFDDGDDALVESAKLKPLVLEAGDPIFARLPMELEFKQGKVVTWDDDKVRVQWPTGAEDWTSSGMIRLQPADESTPAAVDQTWSEGDRVFACWHDLFWYPGSVLAVNGEQYHVVFDNGGQALISGDRIKPLAVAVGDKVMCRWKGGPEFFPGEITERIGNGDLVHIQYDDGDEETTLIRLVRLQRDDWFGPTEMANLQEGDRILGCWFDSHWYPGIVLSVDGKRLRVMFDDGDQAMLTPDKVRALEIRVGDRVWCRAQGGPAYFAGEIIKKEGEVITISYDDGREETTSIRLVRIQSDSSADLGQRSA